MCVSVCLYQALPFVTSSKSFVHVSPFLALSLPLSGVLYHIWKCSEVGEAREY